jgi:hypothetical protein
MDLLGFLGEGNATATETATSDYFHVTIRQRIEKLNLCEEFKFSSFA